MSISAEKRMKQHGREVVGRGHKIFREVEMKAPAALRLSADGSRQVSGKSRSERRRTIKAFIFWLVVEYPLHSIYHVKPKHMATYCRYMENKPLAAATIATTLSHLAVLCEAINKPDLLRDRHQYFSKPELLTRSGVAKREKTLESAGVEFMSLYERAHAINPRVACQFALSWFFGMRAKESWCFRPHEALRDGRLNIEWGTKGGLKRLLKRPLTDEQLSLLEYAKSMTPKWGSMIDGQGNGRRKTLKKWKGIYYAVARQVGLTKDQLGVTPHALRHSYANGAFEKMSERVSPLRGGVLSQTDPELDRAVRTVVAEELGHARPSISSAYIGGVRPVGEPNEERRYNGRRYLMGVRGTDLCAS